jgi:hypothetical protein
VQIIDNIPVWGSPVDEGALKQIKTCYYIFGRAAMMADHHKGCGIPIGGVIAHENLVSPSGALDSISGVANKAVPTSPGGRRTRGKTCGLCAKEPRRHFPGRRDLSAAPWGTSR